MSCLPPFAMPGSAAAGPASSWRVWQDSGEPGQILEQFVVASWQEHQLQRARVTVRDQNRYDAIGALTDPAHPTAVTHWLTPELGHGDHRVS